MEGQRRAPSTTGCHKSARQQKDEGTPARRLAAGGAVGLVPLLHPGVLDVQEKQFEEFIDVIRVVHLAAGELVIEGVADIEFCALPVHLRLGVEPGHGQAVARKRQVIFGMLRFQAII